MRLKELKNIKNRKGTTHLTETIVGADSIRLMRIFLFR